MNKITSVIIAAVIGILLIGGGAMAYRNNQNDKKEVEKMAMEKSKKAAEKEAMAKEDAMKKDGDSMKKEDVMAKPGSYITLADYNTNPSKYADSKKIYYFHASWCPICQAIEKEINADMTKIPAGVTLIKTDFDNSTALRKKYGVTYQHTFVQVDENGNETAQWSATTLDKVVAGIKS